MRKDTYSIHVRCGLAATLISFFSLLGAIDLGASETEKLSVPPKEIDGVRKNVLLPPGPNNPRNSEGDFIELDDGRILFIYTHFYGGSGDHDPARLAWRVSHDRGVTWSEEDEIIVEGEGDMNDMSVSLLRLDDGRIALFYLRKNSLEDLRPLLRISDDEAETWSEPIEIITDEIAAYVVNNDRVIQTSSGRLVVPAALHQGEDGSFLYRGKALCYLSDDNGETWRRSRTVLDMEQHPDDETGLQEPGVVELSDGRLMMFSRTDRGSQYISFSDDEGDTWSPVEPSNIISPRSPASMKRIPSTGDLLLVWNDHSELDPELEGRRRTPFTVAVSKDEGKTWTHRQNLENHPEGWYCYTAIAFVDEHVLLGHVAGRRSTPGRLATTQITRFPVEWLYEN